MKKKTARIMIKIDKIIYGVFFGLVCVAMGYAWAWIALK